MKYEFSKKNIIIVTAFILLIIIAILIYNYRNNENGPLLTTKSAILVSDYSRFFTISKAANKYINYLSSQDKSNLMKLLNDDYIKLNEIRLDNVLSKLDDLSSNNYIFEARKIYQKKINNNIIKYYLYGYLLKDLIDSYAKPLDYYMIIYLDTSSFTYNVTPDNGTAFKGSAS